MPKSLTNVDGRMQIKTSIIVKPPTLILMMKRAAALDGMNVSEWICALAADWLKDKLGSEWHQFDSEYLKALTARALLSRKIAAIERAVIIQSAMDDLFRPCIAGDACGHCPHCATDERGHENG